MPCLSGMQLRSNMNFNEDSRQKNAILASAAGVVEQLVAIISVFVFRTVFLWVLSKEYLGIEGLFTNILQLFSLAELGIGSAILFRMYKPFADKDVDKIRSYVQFYKNVYHGIAGVILLVALCLYPFINSIVNASDVPGDVNLQTVYVLFVLQNIVGYVFAYKQAVISANQTGYLISIFNTVVTVSVFGIKIVLLLIMHNYEAVLLGGVIATVLINVLFSTWISSKYKEFFKKNVKLPKEEKVAILKETSGLMCHKIGYIVLTGTDNIVLSKFVNLAAVGIYTNYATITTSVMNLLNRLLSSFVPTIGNFIVTYGKESAEDLYKKLQFVNMWLASFCAVCLYILLNPFIEVWLDDSFLLSKVTVIVLCSQFYIKGSQMMSNSFIYGAGLFARDRIRPLIESVMNLVISIVLAKEIGIAGVFIGTCISSLCTSFWREPYLLYKYVFETNMFYFVKSHILWLGITCLTCLGVDYVSSMLPITFLGVVGRGVICALGVNVFYAILWSQSKEFKYFLGVVLNKVLKR
jgi:O-antigen/teichoic acid export membrane protein